MNWGSAQAFFDMGGYGLYVWGSYGVTAACILWEIIALRRRASAARADVRRQRFDTAQAPAIQSAIALQEEAQPHADTPPAAR